MQHIFHSIFTVDIIYIVFINISLHVFLIIVSDSDIAKYLLIFLRSRKVSV